MAVHCTRKKLLYGVCCLLVLYSLVGCSTKPAQKETKAITETEAPLCIEIGTAYEEYKDDAGKYISLIMDMIEEEYPDYAGEVVVVPESGLEFSYNKVRQSIPVSQLLGNKEKTCFAKVWVEKAVGEAMTEEDLAALKTKTAVMLENLLNAEVYATQADLEANIQNAISKEMGDHAKHLVFSTYWYQK